MNNLAFIRNWHGGERYAILDRDMIEYLVFAKYSRWGKSIQRGADFKYIKQCKFQSSL